MSLQLFKNNAYGYLAATIDNDDTTLTLSSGQGARFPNPTGTDYFLLTLIGLDNNGAENAWEIVKCTARSTDTLTVVRAQESTSAAGWNIGTRVELRVTAGTLDGMTQVVEVDDTPVDGATTAPISSNWAFDHLATLHAPVNDIGVPGELGFGVGICPSLPVGYDPLPGTFDRASDQYGNYRYRDGSIMCWIPAIWVKYTDGEPVDVKPLSTYTTEPIANAAGYVSHRGDWDGGEHKLGQFVDKYKCSLGSYKGAAVASSLANGVPLVSYPAALGQVGFAAVGAANACYGAIDAAKTRGTQFFPKSRAITAKLALLSLVHGKAATGTTNCAWYDSSKIINFPKGCNGNNLKDVDDSAVTYVTADAGGTYPNAPKTGSGTPFAKTTHNGQACGVADLNGGYWEVDLGMTCIASAKTISGATQANPVEVTATAHGFSTGDIVMIDGVNGMTQIKDKLFQITKTGDNTFTLDNCDGSSFGAWTSGGTATKGTWYVTKTSVAMKDYTSGASGAADHWGATGVAATMQAIVPNFRLDYPNNGVAQRFGGTGATWRGGASGDDWHRDGLALPKATGLSANGINAYGQDYFYQYVRDAMCMLSGGVWSDTSRAGVWFLAYYARTSAYNGISFRSACYC